MRVTVSPRWGEAAVGLSLVGVSLYVGATALNLPLGSLNQPGPGLFPLAIAVFLGVVAAGLVVQALRPAQDPAQDRVDLGGVNVVAVAVALAGLLAAWKTAGFLVGTVAFLTLLFRVLARLPWVAAVALGVGAGGGLWACFTYLLGVRLPPGLLG